jgi:parallel beta-helix repeat protein
MAEKGLAQVTYTVDRSVGTGRVTGTITTNGDLGVLSVEDIVAWNLSIDADGNGSFVQLTGPLSAPPPGPGMPPGTPPPLISLFGTALTATETGLFWDFRYATIPPPPGPPPTPNILEFRSLDFSVLWQLNAQYPFLSGESLQEAPNVQTGAFGATDLVQIATTVIAPLEISADTTLTADRRGPVVIAADNVTLDCARHTVTGSPKEIGIRAVGRIGVTIKSCDSSGFGEGIVLESSSQSVLSENTLSGHTITGIRLTDAGRNRLTGNYVTHTHGKTRLSSGLVLGASSRNRLEFNTIEDSDAAGIILDEGSESNELVANVSVLNGGAGFEVGDSTSNSFLRNTATRNGDFGFILREQAKRNKLLENSACLNRPNDATELRDGRRSNGNVWALNLFCSPSF